MLNTEFNRIKALGWIKSKRSGPTGVGYTFERLLKKEEDSLPIWDFEGIEIKAKRKNSLTRLHLFNATPDGDFLYPIPRILEKIGYPDKDFGYKKILNISVVAKDYTSIGFYKKVKLRVNYLKRKIELIGINSYGKDLELDISWSFKMLKTVLNNKLNYLAIVSAKSCNIRGCEYFLYDEIKFYKFKGFSSFIRNIELGNIFVTFKIGVFKSGKRLGETHDRGTDFSIELENIGNIYEELDISNY